MGWKGKGSIRWRSAQQIGQLPRKLDRIELTSECIMNDDLPRLDMPVLCPTGDDSKAPSPRGTATTKLRALGPIILLALAFADNFCNGMGMSIMDSHGIVTLS